MKTGKKEIKNIFEWLNEITLYKTPVEEISEESWNVWNSWLVHKYVSMDIRYVELANYVQTLPYENKQQTYLIYREMIPKAKTFLKYIKSRTKRQPTYSNNVITVQEPANFNTGIIPLLKPLS